MSLKKILISIIQRPRHQQNLEF